MSGIEMDKHKHFEDWMWANHYRWFPKCERQAGGECCCGQVPEVAIKPKPRVQAKHKPIPKGSHLRLVVDNTRPKKVRRGR